MMWVGAGCSGTEGLGRACEELLMPMTTFCLRLPPISVSLAVNFNGCCLGRTPPPSQGTRLHSHV